MNLSKEKEHYLKTLFKFRGFEEYVSNKTISDDLKVAPASVSEMISKMSNDKLVTQIPYSGVMLTEDGINEAVQVVRKHRLAEYFLYEKLGYRIDELDEIAGMLEHISSIDFYNRLSEFLGSPKVCPHGGKIPTPMDYKETNVSSLLEFEVGNEIDIKRIIDSKDILIYLTSINIELNSKIFVKAKDDINKILFFNKVGSEKVLYISYELAEMVFCEKC